jgi:hypothetical protein
MNKGLFPLGYSYHTYIHNVMMKPWQTLLNNAPNKGGKPKQRETEREEGPKSLAEAQRPTGRHKGAKEQQVMFQSPHQSQEAYQRRKGKETCKHKTVVVIVAACGKPLA